MYSYPDIALSVLPDRHFLLPVSDMNRKFDLRITGLYPLIFVYPQSVVLYRPKNNRKDYSY